MINGVLQTHADDHADALARSEQWQKVRQRYAELSVGLIVNGHVTLANRVDREYQALRDAIRTSVSSPVKRSIADDYDLWEAATEFQFTVGHLENWKSQLAAASRVVAATELPTPSTDVSRAQTATSESSDPPKQSWTQADLDEAIRQYKSKRASTVQQYLKVLDDPKAPAHRKKLIRKQAAEVFGRNVIAPALGVKSAKMVSQSKPWIALAKELKLKRRSDPATVAMRPQNKIGHEIAVEQASMEAEATDDHAAVDIQAMQDEREETLRQIRKLAQSDQSNAQSSAKSLYEQYEAGEMTDDQVRQTIAVLAMPVDSDYLN
jgi:hypothetical protein